MIQNSGNHLADQAEKELDDADRCPRCRRHMELVEWCDEGRKCDFCRGDDESLDCKQSQLKLYCHHCEISVDTD